MGWGGWGQNNVTGALRLIYANLTAFIEDFDPTKLIPKINPGLIGICKHIFRGTYSGAYIRRPFLLVCACDELQNLSLYQQKIDIIFKNDCFKSQSQLYFALNSI